MKPYLKKILLVYFLVRLEVTPNNVPNFKNEYKEFLCQATLDVRIYTKYAYCRYLTRISVSIEF